MLNGGGGDTSIGQRNSYVVDDAGERHAGIARTYA